MNGSITHSCGCTNPLLAYLVEYESEDCDPVDGFQKVRVTASMCGLHALQRFAYGDVTKIERLDE